jgi:hypothetical protein
VVIGLSQWFGKLKMQSTYASSSPARRCTPHKENENKRELYVNMQTYASSSPARRSTSPRRATTADQRSHVSAGADTVVCKVAY